MFRPAHEAPSRAQRPRLSTEHRAARGTPAPAQVGRCPGAAAQLAAVHRTLRHGPVLQCHAGAAAADACPATAPKAAGANRTGLPDRLQAGVEALSGISLDGVKVHYNSSKPAQLNAHAYAQGSDIHLAPGQERHLPHEAWHVVQQAQGRVKPLFQLADGLSVNDDRNLEQEAEAMGARALDGVAQRQVTQAGTRPAGKGAPVQRVISESFKRDWLKYYFGEPASKPFLRKTPEEVWNQITQFLQICTAQRKPSLAEIAEYYEVEAAPAAAEAEAEQELPDELAIQYGAHHGDLHFIAHPTENKSAWSISKQAAQTLMENEITARMADIIRAAAQIRPRTLAWILVADAPDKIGSTVATASVSRFQIQLQATLVDNTISYHGFPDDQALHTGLGPGRNSLT